MRLCFLRHATAVDSASSDGARVLTSVGEKEAQQAGTGLMAAGIAPAVILASPLLRAWQTAVIVARTMRFAGPVTKIDELANDRSTQELLRALQPYAASNEILLVGHMPSLAEHITELTGAVFMEGFGKGSAALVDMAELRCGAGRVVWRKSLDELLAKR